jgi:protein-S-isoprenylcysteine O-methyltransferase Ste14
MTLLKTLIFVFIVPGTVTVVVPYLLLSSPNAPPHADFGALSYLGLLPIVVGACVNLWCAWDFTFAGRGTPMPFDPPKELVARGLYRYVRNPMYVGVVSVLLGEALLFASSRLLVYAVAAFLFFFLFILLYEEPTLDEKFGESYRRYRERVPRWIPRAPRGGESERADAS